MTEYNLNDIAAKSLGDSTSYAIFSDTFDSSLLNPLPRQLARDSHNIIFEGVGFDVWHCYESTFLLNSGKPVSGTLKFVYPASSPYIIESKSMKLYLNSFDMCRMGSTTEEAILNYTNQIKKDLEHILNTSVAINFFDDQAHKISVKSNLLTGCQFIDIDDSIEFNDFKGKFNHIEFSEELSGNYYTNVLRSRCRHTKQKDTGTAAMMQYNPASSVTADSFFRQVVSLREVDEFHEFCAEKLFSSVIEKNPKHDFCIVLLYSRRGSLDINPVRATDSRFIDKDLIDVYSLTEKCQGQ